MRSIYTIIFSLFVVFTNVYSFAQTTGTLHVEIGSLKNSKGTIALAIHNGEEGYPGSDENLVEAFFVEIIEGKAIAEFNNLPFGEYAISSYHDENNNEDLDTNWLGIPKEGTGASNNAKGKMGPPKYEDAKFDFTKDGQKILLDMNYF